MNENIVLYKKNVLPDGSEASLTANNTISFLSNSIGSRKSGISEKFDIFKNCDTSGRKLHLRIDCTNTGGK